MLAGPLCWFICCGGFIDMLTGWLAVLAKMAGWFSCLASYNNWLCWLAKLAGQAGWLC
jgi:hypothetical protein